MRFRLEVLGPFKLIDLRNGRPIPFRSNARLLTFLAVSSPERISRRSLVNTLWPDVDGNVANNRLRVTLTKLRQLLPNAIEETDEGLCLCEDVVESDIQTFRSLVENASDASREEDELENLHEAFGYLTRNAKANRFQGWPLEELAAPFEVFHSVCQRLCELGIRLNRDALVCEVARLALLLWPDDSDLWHNLLEASHRLAKGKDAVRELTETKNRALLEDKRIRPLIDRILKEDSKKQTSEGEFSQTESFLATEILKTAIAKMPEVSRVILSSPETLTLAGAYPREMLNLLEQVVDQPAEKDAHWERCMARIVGLKAWLGDTQGVFDYGHRLIATCERPIYLRAVWNAIALAHALRRDWERADAAIEETIRYAQLTENPLDLLSAKGNQALFLMHQGRFEDAENRYDNVLNEIKELGTPQADFDREMGAGNKAFIPVMQGRWDEALARLEACYQRREAATPRIPMDTLLPCLAMVRLMTGKTESVLQMFRQSFFNANISQAPQFQITTFEFAACALARTEHKSFARSVVDWAEKWRARVQLPRSEAEKNLLKVVFEEIGSEQRIGDEELPHIVGRLILSRLRQSLPV